MSGPQPGLCPALEGMDEHELRSSMHAVAGPVSGEAAGAPDLDPVRGAVDGAPEALGVHERLGHKHRVTEALRPVPHHPACAQRQHPRAEVARGAGQEQEARIVGDQMQPGELHPIVPANPAVAHPALQRRRREHHQRQPAPSIVRDIAHRLAHPRHRAQIVVRLHQVAETGFVMRRYDVDDHFRENDHGVCAHTVTSRRLYQGAEGEVQYPRQLLVRRRKNPKHEFALLRQPELLANGLDVRHGQLTLAQRIGMITIGFESLANFVKKIPHPWHVSTLQIVHKGAQRSDLYRREIRDLGFAIYGQQQNVIVLGDPVVDHS